MELQREIGLSKLIDLIKHVQERSGAHREPFVMVAPHDLPFEKMICNHYKNICNKKRLEYLGHSKFGSMRVLEV